MGIGIEEYTERGSERTGGVGRGGRQGVWRMKNGWERNGRGRSRKRSKGK